MEGPDNFDGLTCGVCYNNYDLTTHSPRMLPCGHTLCSDCIIKMRDPWLGGTLTCPFDKEEFTFPVNSLERFRQNFQLIPLIEARLSQVFCQEHQKPLEYICLTDDARICVDCIVIGNHRNSIEHNHRRFQDIKPFYLEKKEYLEDLKKEVFSFHLDFEHIKRLFWDQREVARCTIRQCFQKMKTFLEDQEKNQFLAVDNLFDEKVLDAKKKYEEFLEMKNEIEDKVNQYQRVSSKEGPAKALEKDVWQFSCKMEAFKKIFTSKTDEDFFRELIEKIEESLVTQFSTVESLKFDTSQIYNDFLSAARISSFGQAETLILQDFEIISRIFSQANECQNQTCFSEIISDPIPRSIGELQSLDNMCVSSRNLNTFTPEMMPKFKRVRVFLQNVKSLCICLNHSLQDNISEQKVQDFLQILFWDPLKLTQIRFHLSTSIVTDKTLHFLADKIFSKALNLQHLCIDFDQTSLSPRSIETFLKSLASISPNLISLGLDFSKLSFPSLENFTFIEPSGLDFSKLSFPSLENFTFIELLLPKLKRFDAKFSNTTLDDRAFDGFLKKTMDSLNEIDTFHLDLLNTNVTEQKASEIFQKILSVFSKCQELRLGMSITEVSQQKVDDFMSQSLVSLEKLKKISLFGYHGEIQRGF